MFLCFENGIFQTCFSQNKRVESIRWRDSSCLFTPATCGHKFSKNTVASWLCTQPLGFWQVQASNWLPSQNCLKPQRYIKRCCTIFAEVSLLFFVSFVGYNWVIINESLFKIRLPLLSGGFVRAFIREPGILVFR
jgi:hypothetical protein